MSYPELEDHHPARRHVTWDLTINLGHVITFIASLAYSSGWDTVSVRG